jgi:hypothetical protein
VDALLPARRLSRGGNGAIYGRVLLGKVENQMTITLKQHYFTNCVKIIPLNGAKVTPFSGKTKARS